MPGNDSFTKVLLHFDGNLNDDAAGAANAHSWASVVGGTLDNSNFQFGSGSGLYQNLGGSSSNCHSCAANADFDLGSNDFTVDFWVRANLTTSNAWVAGQQQSVGTIAWRASVTASGVLGNAPTGPITFNAQVRQSDGTFITASGPSIASNPTGFHHYALVRTGNSIIVFGDGVAGTPQSISGAVQVSTGSLSVGRAGDFAGANGINSNVDEFRLSIGIARWTTNFTPPTAAYDSVTNHTVNLAATCATTTTIKASRLIVALIAVVTSVTLRKSALKLIAIAFPALVAVTLDIARIVRAALYKVRGNAPSLDKSRANSNTLQKSRSNDPSLDQ